MVVRWGCVIVLALVHASCSEDRCQLGAVEVDFTVSGPDQNQAIYMDFDVTEAATVVSVDPVVFVLASNAVSVRVDGVPSGVLEQDQAVTARIVRDCPWWCDTFADVAVGPMDPGVEPAWVAWQFGSSEPPQSIPHLTVPGLELKYRAETCRLPAAEFDCGDRSPMSLDVRFTSDGVVKTVEAGYEASVEGLAVGNGASYIIDNVHCTDMANAVNSGYVVRLAR